jgi:Bacterial Ig domain
VADQRATLSTPPDSAPKGTGPVNVDAVAEERSATLRLVDSTAVARSTTPGAQRRPQIIAPSATPIAAPKPVTGTITLDHLAASVFAVFGFGSSSTPALPTDPIRQLQSLLTQAWVAVRREIDGVIDNQAPTAAPGPTTQLATGEIIGNLQPSDANADALDYKVSQGPANGKVVINADGSYVYTPTPGFAATGGTDTFTVTVDDQHRALFQTDTTGTHLSLFTNTGHISVPVSVQVTPTLGLTTNFSVTNLTGYPMKLTGYAIGTPEVGPAVGAILLPGATQKFEVEWYFFGNNRVDPRYSSIEFPGVTSTVPSTSYDATFETDAVVGTPSVACNVHGGGSCSKAGGGLTFRDNAGTVINVGPDQSALQGAILKAACADGAKANCSFNATSQQAVQSTAHPVGNAVENTTDTAASTTVSVTDTVSESDSVSISAKVSAKLTDIVNVEISATYGHTWTKTNTFQQSVTVPVPPHSVSTITARQPVYRVTGDFTVQVGNTTYHLTGVTFDTPNPDGQGAYTIVNAPLTGAEQDELADAAVVATGPLAASGPDPVRL